METDHNYVDYLTVEFWRAFIHILNMNIQYSYLKVRDLNEH